jgi:hypothetical protein
MWSRGNPAKEILEMKKKSIAQETASTAAPAAEEQPKAEQKANRALGQSSMRWQNCSLQPKDIALPEQGMLRPLSRLKTVRFLASLLIVLVATGS